MLSGFGRVAVPAAEQFSEDLAGLTENAVLTRGLGRSYGDSSLPPPSEPVAASSTRADRILAFDETTGRVRVEAGLSLADLLRVMLPRRFFPPVVPGTQYVTIGGMVAADVHGKNHHVDGAFGSHVTSLLVRVADGRLVECGPAREAELFWATVGGMGLTGHILEVEFPLRRIPSPWVSIGGKRVPDLDSFMEGLRYAASNWPFSVGWIDCLKGGKALGRGVLTWGRWAEPAEAPVEFPPEKWRPRVPFVVPGFVINPWSVRIFNSLYYHLPRRGRTIASPEALFHPLDAVLDWNLLYGPRGFTQYQCVLPDSAGPAAVRHLLEVLTRFGAASMLGVIKDCGDEGQGLLSFPRRGTSIACDIPIRDNTPAVIDALNEKVIAEGGRVYLAKDTFSRPEHFRAMEPRLARFQEVRGRWDPEGRIRSAQSVRLFGDRP
jgi:FAD/FMN-containing dehydrogenase